MNLPLFLPGMQNFIVISIAVLAGAAIAIYLLKYKFKHPVIRKCLTIFVLTIAGLVTAYVLFYIISNAVGRAKVESKLASMHERKILISEEDVFPKMLANTDNGANFYMAVFSLMDASTSYATFDKMNIKHSSNIQEWTKDDQKIAQKLLATEDLNLIIDLLHQGTEKPYAVYKRHYNGLSILLPESTSQRELFRFISTKSFCEGLAGNKEAGYHLLLDGFKMIIQFKGEKILVLQLNNIACVSINIRSMNELISRYGVSTSSAIQLLAELEKINFNQAMINGFDGDIMMWRDDIFGKIINGETEHCIEQFKDVLPANKRNIVRYLSLIWPFFYQDYACYLTQMDKIRNLFDKPYWSQQNEINELSNRAKIT